MTHRFRDESSPAPPPTLGRLGAAAAAAAAADNYGLHSQAQKTHYIASDSCSLVSHARASQNHCWRPLQGDRGRSFVPEHHHVWAVNKLYFVTWHCQSSSHSGFWLKQQMVSKILAKALMRIELKGYSVGNLSQSQSLIILPSQPVR